MASAPIPPKWIDGWEKEIVIEFGLKLQKVEPNMRTFELVDVDTLEPPNENNDAFQLTRTEFESFFEPVKYQPYYFSGEEKSEGEDSEGDEMKVTFRQDDLTATLAVGVEEQRMKPSVYKTLGHKITEWWHVHKEDPMKFPNRPRYIVVGIRRADKFCIVTRNDFEKPKTTLVTVKPSKAALKEPADIDFTFELNDPNVKIETFSKFPDGKKRPFSYLVRKIVWSRKVEGSEDLLSDVALEDSSDEDE